jgi:ubiquinone/menaquinone biosynthesis C-methylase UbiE
MRNKPEKPVMIEARIPQGQIPSVYGRIARVYDIWAYLTETRARKACLAAANAHDGESILEVAVGTGLAFRELLLANPSGLTEGIDLTDPMLARARRKVEGLPVRYRLRVGDAHRLDFADHSFDLLVNNYMFDLLPEQDFKPILLEFFRVLKPGGRLALVNMAMSDRWQHKLYQHIYSLSPKLLGGCRGVELSPFLTSSGFTDIRVEFLSQFGFPSEIVTAIVPVSSS